MCVTGLGASTMTDQCHNLWKLGRRLKMLCCYMSCGKGGVLPECWFSGWVTSNRMPWLLLRLGDGSRCCLIRKGMICTRWVPRLPPSFTTPLPPPLGSRHIRLFGDIKVFQGGNVARGGGGGGGRGSIEGGQWDTHEYFTMIFRFVLWAL